MVWYGMVCDIVVNIVDGSFTDMDCEPARWIKLGFIRRRLRPTNHLYWASIIIQCSLEWCGVYNVSPDLSGRPKIVHSLRDLFKHQESVYTMAKYTLTLNNHQTPKYWIQNKTKVEQRFSSDHILCRKSKISKNFVGVMCNALVQPYQGGEKSFKLRR